MGVRAVKIEGRQRSPAYVAQVTKIWREAIDQCLRPRATRYTVKTGWMAGSTSWPKASSTPWAPTTAPGSKDHEAFPRPPAVLLAARHRAGLLRRDGGNAGGHRLPRRSGLLAPPRAAPGRLAGARACCAMPARKWCCPRRCCWSRAPTCATMHKIADNGSFMVEANEMGAVHCLAGKAPFVAGPHLNLYNSDALHWMAGPGRHALGDAHRDEARGPRACCSGKSPRPGDRGVRHWAGSRWRSRRAASPHATPTCPRTTAASAASPTRTASSCAAARTSPSWC